MNEKDNGQAFEKHYDRTPPEEQPPFPGVINVCEYICTLGVMNVIITHRGHKGTSELLSANKMNHYFTACLAREDGYPKKPNLAVFEAMLKMCNLQREETLAIGDRDIDVLAGRAAGIFTCLFGLKVDGVIADLTIDSFDKLYRYLVNRNN